MKRGSVGKAQFDSSVSMGFAAPAQWASGVLYDANVDTVFHNSTFYIANTTHTSGGVFEASKWNLLADFSEAAIISDGSIASAKLADGAVAGNKLADGVVANSKLATNAVTTNKVADNAVTFVKLATDMGPSLANMILPAGLGPIPWSGAALPTGWDWADGSVLLANTAFSSLRSRYISDGFPYGQDGSGNPYKPDSRGRVSAGMDTFGLSGASNRLLSGSMNAVRNNIGGAGGSDIHTLSALQLPSHTHANSLTDPGHAHSYTAVSTSEQKPASGGTAAFVGTTGAATSTSTTGITITNASIGGDLPHNNLQPTILFPMIIKAH